jgi:hypothetical protein
MLFLIACNREPVEVAVNLELEGWNALLEGSEYNGGSCIPLFIALSQVELGLQMLPDNS